MLWPCQQCDCEPHIASIACLPKPHTPEHTLPCTARGEVSLESAQPSLDQIEDVMRDSRVVIDKWSAKPLAQGGVVAMLKGMLVSGDFETEFLDLNNRMTEAFHDLGLIMNVAKALEDTAGPNVGQSTQVGWAGLLPSNRWLQAAISCTLVYADLYNTCPGAPRPPSQSCRGTICAIP